MAKKVNTEELSDNIVSSLTEKLGGQKKTLPKHAQRANPSARIRLPKENNNKDEEEQKVLINSIAYIVGSLVGAIELEKTPPKIQQITDIQRLVKEIVNKKTKGAKNNAKRAITGSQNRESDLEKSEKQKSADFRGSVVSKLDKLISFFEPSATGAPGAPGGTMGAVDVNINANSNASEFLKAISNEELEEQTKAALTGMVELTDEKGPLNEYIDNLEELNEKTKKIGDFDELKKSQENLKTAVGSMDKEKTKQIQVSMEGWVEMAKAVAIASATLLAAGYVMRYVKVSDVLKFAGLLALFLTEISITAIIVGKHAKSAAPALKAALGLVTGCALIMFFGQMVAEYIDFGNLMFFTVALGIFLLTIGSILSLVLRMLPTGQKKSKTNAIFGKSKNNDVGSAEPLVGPALSLVTGAALIMLIGSLVMPIINIKNLFMFTMMLGLFLFTIFGIVALISKMMHFGNTTINVTGGAKKAMTNNIKGSNPLTDALKLVIGATFIMFLGSFAVDAIKPGKLLKFTVYLAGFLLAIGGALSLGKAGWEVAGKGAMKMVAMATLIMFIGALAVDQIPFGNLMKFTVSLSLFLLGIGGALRLGGKGWEKNAKNVMLIVFSVGLLSAAMLSAGYLYIQYPGLDAAVAIYCVTATLFIGALAAIAWLLAKKERDIIKGAAAMAILGGVANLLSTSILILAFAVNQTDMGNLWQGFLIMALIAGGLAALCYVMGIGAEFTIIGAKVVAVIAGVALALATSVMILAMAMEKMSQIEEFDAEPILNNISNIKDVMWQLVPLGFFVAPIIAAEVAILGLIGVLSLMSVAIKDYSELKVPVYVGTKVVGYRQLTQRDFTDAAKNVSQVVTVLSEAVIRAVEKHPEYFEWGPFSKLAMACKALESLGPLISKIATAVKDYAELRVPEEWNSKGQPTKYRHLEDNDFKAASENVKKVVKVLGGAIVQVYEENPDLYTAGGFGDLIGMDTPFVRVIKSNMQLAKLIATISKAVYDVACGAIPIQWNSKGEGIAFEHIEKRHYKEAAKNTKLIITTLGNVIVEIASDEKMAELYGTDFTDFLGIDNKFTRVIKANMKLGEMISKISKGVLDFANGRVTTKWNEKGEGVQFEKLEKKHFKAAQKNITQIINILGETVADQANNPKTKDLYGSAFTDFLGIDNKFTRVINGNILLGKMVAKIGESVNNMANLNIVIYEKNSDKIKTRIPMKPGDFQKAGQSIDNIISILGTTISKQYDKHKKWYDEKDKNNPIYRVINACIGMSKIVSEIAKAMKDYADLRIPTDWDKEGKVTGWRSMEESDFENAGNSILKIISLLGDTIIKLYDKKPEWFNEKDKDKNPLFRVLDCANSLAKLVGEMGRGIKEMAQSQYVDVNGKTQVVEQADIEKAGENVGNIVCVLAEKLIELGKEGSPTAKYFEPTKLESKTSIGFIKMSKMEEGNSTMKNVVNSVIDMGQLIAGIAEGVRQLADLKYTDVDGKPKRLTDNDFKKAGDNIAHIITAIGGAMMETYNNEEMFKKPIYVSKTGTKVLGGLLWDSGDEYVEGTSEFDEMMRCNIQLGTLISTIAQGVVVFAQGYVMGSDGKPIRMTPTLFQSAGDQIKEVLTATGKAIVEVANNKETATLESPKMQSVVKGITDVAGVVTNIAEAIKILATGEIPTEYDPKTGKVTKTTHVGEPEIKAAGDAIEEVLTAIGDAISNTVAGHPDIFKVATITNTEYYTEESSSFFGLSSSSETKSKTHTEFGGADTSPMVIASKGFSLMAGMVADIAEAIVNLGQGTIPLLDAEGKPTGKYRNIDYKEARENLKIAVSDILGAMIDSITGAVHKYPEMFEVQKLVSNNNQSGAGGVGLGILYASISSGNASSQTMASASTAPFAVAASSIAAVLGLVSDVADAIKEMATMQYPVYKNGQLDHYDKVTQTDIDNAKDNITKLIKEIYQGVIEALTLDSQGNQKSASTILHESIIGTLIKNMSLVFQAVSSAIDTMSDFFTAMREIKFNDPKEFEKLLGDLKVVMEHSELLEYIILDQDANRVNTVLQEIYPDKKWALDKSFGYVFGKTFTDDADPKDINKKLPMLTSVIETTIDQVKEIYTLYKEAKSVINAFIDPNENIGLKIAAAMEQLTPIMQLFVPSQKTSKNVVTQIMDYFTKKEEKEEQPTVPKNFIDYLNEMDFDGTINNMRKLFALTNTILDGFIDVGDRMNIASHYDYGQINYLVDDFKNCLLVMASLGSENVDLMGNMQRMPSADEMTKILIVTDKFYSAINNIVWAAIRASEVKADAFDVLCYGISVINETIKSLNARSIQLFNQQTNTLSRFVTVVNKLKINNIDRLTQFVMSMNLLASQLGNIDNLTKVLAEKLSKALEDLTKRLEHAERTIQDADVLQRRRHELIKQSVEEVKKIMSQSIMVEVSQTGGGMGDGMMSPSLGTPGGGTPLQQMGTPGGGTPPTPSSQNLSPATPTPGGSKVSGGLKLPKANLPSLDLSGYSLFKGSDIFGSSINSKFKNVQFPVKK